MDLRELRDANEKRHIEWAKGADISLSFRGLELAGEAGEVAEKVKKIIRDGDGTLTDPDREKIAKELSDVCWYVAVLAYELDYTLEEVMQINLDKLRSRQERGVLSGSGDNR